MENAPFFFMDIITDKGREPMSLEEFLLEAELECTIVPSRPGYTASLGPGVEYTLEETSDTVSWPAEVMATTRFGALLLLAETLSGSQLQIWSDSPQSNDKMFNPTVLRVPLLNKVWK